MSQLSTERYQQEPVSAPRIQLWTMLIVGVATGVLGMHLAVYRPMKRQMQQQADRVQDDLSLVRRDLSQMMGQSSRVGQATALLTRLNAQHALIDRARTSLAALETFRKQVETAGNRTLQTFAAVDSLSSLQDTLLENHGLTGRAAKALDDVSCVTERLVDEAQTNLEAADSLETLVQLKRRTMAARIGIAEAECSLRELGQLKLALQCESDGASEAQGHARQLIALKNIINLESDDIDSARINTEELLSLKDEIVVRGGNTFAARNNARQMMVLNEKLAAVDQLDVQLASSSATELMSLAARLADAANDPTTSAKNLESLLRIHTMLKSRTGDIVDAIQTLELLSDFNQTLKGQVVVLKDLRREMIEIALMETTVVNAMRVIRPLLQVVDLRRLSDGEIREAARVILEKRSTRLGRRASAAEAARPGGSHPEPSSRMERPSRPVERFVPLPRDAE